MRMEVWWQSGHAFPRVAVGDPSTSADLLQTETSKLRRHTETVSDKKSHLQVGLWRLGW